MSKNLHKIKARDVGHVMDAIVQLVQVRNRRKKYLENFRKIYAHVVLVSGTRSTSIFQLMIKNYDS